MSELKDSLFPWTLIKNDFPKHPLRSDTVIKAISVYYKISAKIHFILPFPLWQSVLNSTHSHCDTRLRETVPTPLGMKKALQVEWMRPAFVHLLHPGSTLRRLWRPGPPESPSYSQQSHQRHMGWSTPSLWSGKSKLKSRRHSSDSTGNRHGIHTEPSSGLVWHMERRRRVLLFQTAKPAEKHESHALKYYNIKKN